MPITRRHSENDTTGIYAANHGTDKPGNQDADHRTGSMHVRDHITAEVTANTITGLPFI